MRGIDISNWQASINLEKLKFDFCICKATEGLTFVDPYCDGFIQKLIKLNKLWGFYHFNGTNSPEKEAEYFYTNCKNYFNHGIPVLDYEVHNANDRDWIEKFVSKLYQLSGVYCVVYMSASWCSIMNGSWVPDKCGLWVAGYPYNYEDWTVDHMPYNISPWKFAAIWQFTSSLRLNGFWDSLDGDIAYMDSDGWNKYANTKGNSGKVQPTLSYKELVLEILIGEWGNGDDRKRMLKEHGYDYETAQNMINKYYEIADEVIAGKWGNGWNRENALNGAGYNYQAVQYIVNQKLGY